MFLHQTAQHTSTKSSQLQDRYSRHQETTLYDFGRFEHLLLTLPAQEKRYGLGFAYSPRLIPDRVGVLEMNLSVCHFNIVTAYAPHSGWPLTEVNTFYSDLRADMDQFARRDITTITGDFNSKLGCHGTIYTSAFMHVIHSLAGFCDPYHLFATNTAFQKRLRTKPYGANAYRHTAYTVRLSTYSANRTAAAVDSMPKHIAERSPYPITNWSLPTSSWLQLEDYDTPNDKYKTPT
ncbi:Hypothetical protein PHPALM_20186 [Phytophthora palmivora]|uniref:Endonuclease/exonuclease/phosphatase domain-containing protein n=1 Tax=Phytophthora palmivora TaxID=4796 RepID=A0A2P4XFK2_9STRA|nr:Hypothetical protein PHPALM_20186 [Phytophthora palmivora]